MLIRFRYRILILGCVLIAATVSNTIALESFDDGVLGALFMVTALFPMLWVLGWWLDNERQGIPPPQWMFRNVRILNWSSLIAALIAGAAYFWFKGSYSSTANFIFLAAMQFAFVTSMLVARVSIAHSSPQ